MGKLLKDEKGFGALEAILIIIIVVAIAGVGWFVWQSKQTADKNLAASSSSSPVFKKRPKTSTSTIATSGTAKPATATNTYAGWQEYCSTYEKSCFKYPSTWTLSNNCSNSMPCPGVDNVSVTSPNKTLIYFQSSIAGRGGMCQPGTPNSQITSVTALPSVKGLYLVQFSRADTGDISFGVDDTINGAIPKTGDTGSCAMYTQFTAKNTTNAGVDLSGQVPSSAKTSDLSNALLVMNSYYYK